MTCTTAPGKIILFGEHAVVYGRPAIAAPLSQLRATAVVEDSRTPGIRLLAADLGTDIQLDEAAADDPVAAVVRQLQRAAELARLPDLTITITSQIPIASGLGSGAAITAAVIRALTLHLGLAPLSSDDWVSDLTYEIEKIHHGTPSGIDNTVVAYEKPVYFVRQQPRNRIETFAVGEPLRLLVADTGQSSSTKAVVGDVRRQWQANTPLFEALFDGCGRIAQQARQAIEDGRVAQVGRLMNDNHQLLQDMTVSSSGLDALVRTAREAGALGAKLSGAGRGGNMIALVTLERETAVTHALQQAGARSVLTTVLAPTSRIPDNGL
ncbi:MAG: mevalonate kinase [Ardenticatenaceae bacterium]|nr:mevalonate kinase [Ardenticatenaceae bacterium]